MSYIQDRIKLAIARGFLALADGLTDKVVAQHQQNVAKAMARNAAPVHRSGAATTKPVVPARHH